jgi:hypothetical protein
VVKTAELRAQVAALQRAGSPRVRTLATVVWADLFGDHAAGP